MNARFFVTCALAATTACDATELEPIGEGGGGGVTSSASGTPATGSGAPTGQGGASTSSAATSSADGASVSGTPASSGASSGTGGPPAEGCKRGIASNDVPGPAFAGRVAWWNNWALGGDGVPDGIEFVPMVWGADDVGDPFPEEAAYLLGFNEPNFHAQSDLTAQEAAAAWPQIEASAGGRPLVSPAMNYCGPEDQCNGTSPYQYLRDFFAACSGCRVDYVAVHWYNCDLPSLQDYLEPGGGLEGFEQFGKPVWLTEFSCDPSASVADQEAYMREAIPYLEGNPNVFRYSWFSAGPIPNAELLNDDGSPKPLGEVYASLPRACDE
jgi:hypothetical protein